jgi:hypothetical protein
MLFGFSILWSYLWFDQFMLQWYGNLPDETHYWVKRFDVSYFKAAIFISLAINFLFPLLFLIKRGAKRNFRMIGFGAAFLIFGHYIDFFNLTFVEPNWNKKVQAEHKEKEMTNWEQAWILGQETVKSNSATEGQATSKVKTVKDISVAGGPATPRRSNGVEKLDTRQPEAEADINDAGMGVCELLIFIGFLGAFLYLFFLNLAKRPIIPENDPYLKENEKLEVTYA